MWSALLKVVLNSLVEPSFFSELLLELELLELSFLLLAKVFAFYDPDRCDLGLVLG